MPVPLLAISRTEIDQITLLELDDSERELATIRMTSSQPFGLAFDETCQWLYSACWTSGKIAAIDLSVLKEQKSFSVPRLPGWATRRAGSSEIWISNEGADVVTVIDTRTGTVSAQIATGGGPSDIVFTENGRHAWVTNEKDGNVSVIDAETRCNIRNIRIGEVPQGMAVAGAGAQLLVANFGSNSISVVDTVRMEELTQIAVGRGPVDVVARGGEPFECAWVTCFSEGAVSMVGLDRHQEIQRIVTGGKPQGLERHPKLDRVYVAVRGLNELLVLSADVPCSILRRIRMDGGPARMAIAAQPDVHKDTPSR
jgi:YVTN family beta-propeller protein